MKFQKIKNTKHYVYDSYDEFETHYRERGMEVPPIVADWREAGAGDWTYSDDERIVQILVRKVLPNRKYNKNPYVRTVVGSFVVNRFTQMDTDFDAHPSRYRFSKRTKKELYQWRMDRPNLTKNERILIAKLKLNMPVREAWESTYGGIKDWRYKLVDLIKTERFQKEMNQDVDDIAQKLGLSYEYILSKLKDLIEESDSDNVKLASLRELSVWLKKDATVTRTVQTKGLYAPVDMRALETADEDRLKALEEAERDD